MELIGEEEKRELLEVIESGYLFRYGSPDNPAFKAKVYQLEQQVARLVGASYAVAVNSGTSALLAALSGLGVGPGDEVIIPGYTFIASISSIIYARAIPILAEVDRTLNLDPQDVRRKITPRTKAILPVHMLGIPARMDELKAIASEHGLLLLEDCAQAFGARYKGKGVGSIGDAGIFSFNIYKTITAEGCPFTCPYYKGGQVDYRKGMLPQTDDLLSRAINISIGVSDPGLGSAFGVTIHDNDNTIDDCAELFHRTAKEYL